MVVVSGMGYANIISKELLTMGSSNNTKRCCQTLETMGECGDGAHRLGVFFLDGTPSEQLQEKRERLVEEIRKKMLLISAIDSKLKQGYTVSDVDAKLAKDDIRAILEKIDKAEHEYRAGRLAQA
jgi:hypothetical protein